jgi:hypothetical protein
MTLDLDNFEEQASLAVRLFWEARLGASEKQRLLGNLDQGSRGAVTVGKTMDGFAGLIANLVAANGLHDAEVYLTRGVNTLPGYFRPTKDWDLVVVRNGRLIAALELKSHVGPSFSSNFNNRSEESIGSAVDLWTTFREGAFGDAVRPFVGWFILVEDAAGSRKPVRAVTRFGLDSIFIDASYLQRYEILCRRLVLENLYTEAAVIAAPEGTDGRFEYMSGPTSLRRLVTSFSAHIAAEATIPY